MLGDAWEDLGVLNPTPVGIRSFVYLGSGIVLAGTRGGGLIYKSTDYGKTWVDKGSTPGDEGTVDTLVNCEGGVVVAGMGPNDSDVERSADYGDSFVFIKDLWPVWQRGCPSGAYCGSNIVLIGTDGSEWTMYTGRVFKSTDKGLTWDAGTRVCWASMSSAASMIYLGSGIALVGTPEGEIARTIDYGTNWTMKIFDIGAEQVHGFAHLGNGVVLLVTNTGKVWKSTDYGVNWSLYSDTGAGANAIVYAGNDMVFVPGGFGHVYRSLDGGLTWTDLGVILPGITDSIISFCYFESDTEKVLLAGYEHNAGDARIARTTEVIAPGEPTDLLCEQKKNPTDVTDPNPEFSAIYHA